jgi:flavorubredoxin
VPVIAIKPGIYWIGVNDRTTNLFEGLWPIAREGVSYNSYLIDDEKKAIIDLAKAMQADEYFAQIDEVTDVSEIDYVVLNHMEPDHSGLLKIFKKMAPRAIILCSAKAKDMVASYAFLKDNIQVVQDGEELPLGKGRLKFFSTPFLHWPETIMTYEMTQRILFSCDAFGGYGAIEDSLFNDESQRFPFYEREALRYYSNIVAKYSARVIAAVEKLKDLPVEMIAPSHGLVWRENAGHIIELYKKWAGYAAGKGEPAITLIYGSMYGKTEMMMTAVTRGIVRAGVPFQVFDATKTSTSYILSSLWTNAGVLVGAPTYEVSLFPPVAEVLRAASHKRILNRKLAYFGSYGWSGGALADLKRIIEPLKWELFDALEFPGSPSKETLKRGEELGFRFAGLIKKDE